MYGGRTQNATIQRIGSSLQCLDEIKDHTLETLIANGGLSLVAVFRQCYFSSECPIDQQRVGKNHRDSDGHNDKANLLGKHA